MPDFIEAEEYQFPQRGKPFIDAGSYITMSNPELEKLHPYPFEKLNQLFANSQPADKSPIALSIGEPKHPAPEFVQAEMARNLDKLSKYPTTKGVPELREAIATWLTNRFQLKAICPATEILPVNGTREALFAFTQAMVDRQQEKPLVMMPNPFYQIYEGAALLAGAAPFYLDCTAENRFIPDYDSVSADLWDRCQILFLCTPGNPTGAITDFAQLAQLISLADKHNFIIASDECYSEIYFDNATPPIGLLEACQQLGRTDYKNCIVFHSLSKRSNLPGLRSGFVAGDKKLINDFFKYRTYHGCAMSLTTQLASTAAWQDEQHVKENRELYRKKFEAVFTILEPVLKVALPDAGFYLWPETAIRDVDFARALYEQENVIVLPGSFLSRPGLNSADATPGDYRIRMALVASLEECVEAAQRIRNFING